MCPAQGSVAWLKAVKCAAAALCCRLPACQTKGAIRSKLSASSMLDLCPDLCYRSLPRSVQDSDLSPKSNFGSKLWKSIFLVETSPLNNSPLLTGLEKRYSPKCCFPIGISPLLLPKWCFTTSPEEASRCHRPQNWETPGGPKIHQKTI